MVEDLNHVEAPLEGVDETKEDLAALESEVKASVKENQEKDIRTPSVEEAFFQINSLRKYGTFDEVMAGPDFDYLLLEALAKDLGREGEMPRRDSRRTIVAIQVLLDDQGYDVGEMDGILKTSTKKTSKTMEAIKEFQKDNGIRPVDGLPGPKTLQKLLEKYDSFRTRESNQEEQDFLKGRTSLTDSELKKFLEHKDATNDGIDLKGLKSITDNQAEILSRFSILYLDGLTRITDKQAESLSKKKKRRGSVSLNGLRNITDKQAESLGKIGGSLYLNGLTSITDKQAENLSKVTHDLYLNGLTSITDKQAESLSKIRCIKLNGLKNITDKQAESLGKDSWIVELNGLEKITDKQAEYLGKVEQHVSLNGLTSLTDKQAEGLGGVTAITLNGLKDITDKQVENLLKTKKNSGADACLELNGLTRITDKQATELAKVTGVLSLSGLKSITDKQATELAKGHHFIMNVNEDILTTEQKKILGLNLW